MVQIIPAGLYFLPLTDDNIRVAKDFVALAMRVADNERYWVTMEDINTAKAFTALNLQNRQIIEIHPTVFDMDSNRMLRTMELYPHIDWCRYSGYSNESHILVIGAILYFFSRSKKTEEGRQTLLSFDIPHNIKQWIRNA
ncbi:hypothetical protein BGZ46_008291 [Entomortierella lignicola]|nr:hypothetical protein BGZ46_008291 [Entomortierella lignicola]